MTRWRRLGWAVGVLCALAVVAWVPARNRHRFLRLFSFVENPVLGLLPAPTAGSPPHADWAAAGCSTVVTASGTVVLGHAGRSRAEDRANEAATILRALASGLGVEVDVCVSADGVPYLSHRDDLAARLATSTADVELVASSLIDACPAREGFAPLARLDRLWDQGLASAPFILFDVKTSHENAQRTARALAPWLRRADPRRAMAVSVSGVVLFELRAEGVNLPMGCETFGPIGNHAVGFTVYSAPLRSVTAGSDWMARTLGHTRFYWTLPVGADWQRGLRWSPEFVLADDPGALPPPLRRVSGRPPPP